MHRQPLPGAQIGPIDDASKRSRQSTSHGGRFGKSEHRWQVNQIEIGMGNCGQLCKSTPGGEAEDELMSTNRRIDAATIGAVAAGDNERGRDAVTYLEALALGTDSYNGARQFVTGDVGRSDIRIGSFPGMPVRAADTARCHFNDDAVRRARRVRHVAYYQGLLESLEEGCAHHDL